MPASAGGLVTVAHALRHPALGQDRDHALERRAHRANRAERHRQPLPLGVGDDQVEAATLLAEQRVVGHRDVLERDLGGVGGVPAELLQRAGANAVAGLDDEEGEAAVPGLGAGADGRHVEVGAHAAGDEGLGAVDDPAAVDLLRAGADRRRQSRCRAR
jgi:hypothetical protein